MWRPPRSPLFPSTRLFRPPPAEADPEETAPTARTPSAAEAEEDRRAARSSLEEAAAVLGAPLRLTSPAAWDQWLDRTSTRLNSSHDNISYADFRLKKTKND